VLRFWLILQVTAGEEKKREEVDPAPLLMSFFSWRRVSSRAASGGGACKDAPPLFWLAEGLPCNFWSFRDCFVIFRLCYCNFNVILLFICFGIVFCIVDVKEKKER
jgi:hypothetical protein